jgi:predicted nucleic acid-binding protein
MNKNEFTVSSFSVLNHVHRTKCTAYDCEYVSLAESLKVPLITRNKEILKRFPNLAVRLEDYV